MKRRVENWRRGRDSNPRNACALNGFRDRPDRPLRHLSAWGIWPRLARGRSTGGALSPSVPACQGLALPHGSLACRARQAPTLGRWTRPDKFFAGKRRCAAGAAGRPCPLRDRRGGAPPAVRLSRRDLRRRSGLRQQRGMVSGDPRGHPPAQGPAFLPSPRRECGESSYIAYVSQQNLLADEATSRSTIPRSPACSKPSPRAATG